MDEYLQVLESLANVLVGTAALVIMGFTGTGYSSADDLSAGKTKYWGGTPNVSTEPLYKLYILVISNNFICISISTATEETICCYWIHSSL